MRVSHFAQIQVIVPPSDYTYNTASARGILKTVGMAQNINIDDNFGTRAENTIGTPLPVLAPGYQVTNIRMEKATIDGSDFRNLGAFNPLWAHVGETYRNDSLIDIRQAMNVVDAGASSENGNQNMFPFMFVLAVKNRVSNSHVVSNINHDNSPAQNNTNARANSFGVYACVLQSASIGMTSGNAIIMDSVNAVARPITGSWFNKAIRDAFSRNGDARNGMEHIVNSVLYGYY